MQILVHGAMPAARHSHKRKGLMPEFPKALLEQMYLPEESMEPVCKGLFFRCRVNTYCSMKKGFLLAHSVSLQLLKRMSCSGCRSCAQFFEDAQVSTNIVLPSEPKDGAIYQAIFHEGARDWETGCIEDWDWTLELHNQKEE